MGITIGVLTNHIGGALRPYERAVSRAVFDVARQRDCKVVFYSGGFYKSSIGHESQKNFVFDLVSSDKPDALLVNSALIGEVIESRELQMLCARFAPIPLISLGMEVPGIPGVIIDNYKAMRKNVEHLIKVHGCSSFVYINGPKESIEARLRYKGFRDCLAEYSIPFDESLLLQGTFYASSGRVAAETLIRNKCYGFDAVVSANDEMAVAFMERLSAVNIQCPRDYSITGFDNLAVAALHEPPLTTVEQDTFKLTELAANLLCEYAQGRVPPEVTHLETSFIQRESCGCRLGSDSELSEALPGDPQIALLGCLRNEKLLRKTMLDGERQDAVLSDISEQLISTVSYEQLRDIFEKELPRIPAISACYLSLFKTGTGEGEGLKPVLSYRRGRGAILDFKAKSHHNTVMESDSDSPLRVIEALNYQDEILGVLIFEADTILFTVFGQLREQICNTLHNIHSFGYIEELNAELNQKLERLSSLRAIDKAIMESSCMEDLLDVVMEQVKWRQGVNAVSISLLDTPTGQFHYTASLGFRHTAPFGNRTVAEKTFLSIADELLNPQLKQAMQMEGFTHYAGIPLVIHGIPKGLLELFATGDFSQDQDWLQFLDTLSGQAAIAIENTLLLKNLKEVNQDLRDAYNSTIEGWSRALDLRDHETEGHCLRVAHLSVELGRKFSLDEQSLEDLYRGALLHDIGKVGIPDAILLKAGPLSEAERSVMLLHPQYAHDLLAPIRFLHPALAVPWSHHEKWDGTGYPQGLSGKDIPLSARIFAVIDVWDALLSERPYRQAWDQKRVSEHIRALSGTHFDPDVVEVFLQMIHDRK